MSENVDNRARLLLEALTIGNYTEPVDEVVNRVKRLELGLPVEDEFMAICSWLGQCSLVHKLDQAVAPSASEGCYQVPDFFCGISS